MKNESARKAAKIDYLIGRVIESARDMVAKGIRTIRKDSLRDDACLLLVTGSDPIGRGFYRYCVGAGMHGPRDVKEHMVTTLVEPFEPVMKLGADYYRLEEHIEPTLAASEVRCIVLTLGTLTVVRLDERSKACAWSPSYRAVKPDVLMVATAAWRNDRPEGFLVRAVFQSRAQGDAFSERYHAQLASIIAEHPAKDRIEEELGQFKAANPPEARVPLEKQVRLFAQVKWLEQNGHIPDDSMNGTVFSYGCEIDMSSDEMARALGGPSDGLS
jgi:hypothetical protein